MRAFLLTFFVLVAGILVGCSMPEHVLLRNSSTQTLSITFPNGKTVTIAPGQSAEFSFDYSFMQASVAVDGVRRVFQWRYPPQELMEKTKYPWRFGLRFESDGKLYAEKILSTGEAQPVQKQPDGFPLSSTP